MLCCLKKYFIVVYLLVFFCKIQGYSQEIISTKGPQVLNTTITGNKIYYSGEEVKLAPKGESGFKYTPSSIQNFKGAIHPNYVFGETSTEPLGQGDKRFLDYSLAVGSVVGGGGVGGSSYSYSISFDVPTGTNNMQPNIGLNYSSGGGRGIAGKGWFLSAASVISRTGKNYYNHTEVREVKLDGQDPLSLDGNLLISMGNGVYRTEQEQFLEAVLDNGVFTVQTRDGMIYTYGQSSDYKLSAPNGQVLSWYLSRVQDRFGNYMTYHYTRQGNELLLNEIKYTGTTSFSPYNSVKFEYVTRNDKNTIYIAGVAIESNFLLSKVKTYAEGQLVRTYTMHYSKGELDTYLMDVSEENAQGEIFNPTVFRYGKESIFKTGTIKRNNNLSNNFPWEIEAREPNGYFLIDYDGDGVKEMLEFGAATQFGKIPRLYINGYEYDEIYKQYNNPNYDENGNVIYRTQDDGYIETLLPRIEPNPNNRKSFYNIDFDEYVHYVNANRTNSQSAFSMSSDYNGDGFEDIYVVEKRDDGKFYLTFLLGKEDGLHFINEKTKDINSLSQQLEPEYFREHYSGYRFKLNAEDFPFLIPGDYNGDGRMDLFWIKEYEEGQTPGFIPTPNLGAAKGVIISLNDTDDNIVTSAEITFNPTYENNAREGVLFFQQGDFNGDGITDFLTLETIQVQSGSNTVNKTRGIINLVRYNASNNSYSIEIGGADGAFVLDDNIDASTINLGDFNGDGKMDVLYNNAFIAYNTGKGFVKINISATVPLDKSNWDSTNGTSFLGTDPKDCLSYYTSSNDYVVGDFNGDGKDDIMYLKVRGFSTTAYTLYYSNGIGFVEGYNSGAFSGVLRGEWSKVVDIDGNGVMDIMGDVPQREHCVQVYDQLFINLSRDYTDALQTVSDGYGRTTRIKYENLTHTSNYTKGTGAEYPLVDLTGPMKVPVTITQPDGVGGDMVTEYHYAGLKYHAKGRGVLGFETTEVHNLTTNFKETTTSQLLTDIMLFAPKEQKTYQNGTLISESYTTTQVHKFDSQRFFMHFPYVTTTDYIASTITVNGTTYSDFMLPPTRTEQAVRTSASANIESTVTEVSYQSTNSNEGTGLILPVPLTQKMTATRAGNGAYVREVHNTYTNKMQLATQTTDPGKAKAVTTTYNYDNFGNALSSSVSADGLTNRSVVSEYESKGRFAIKAKNSLNHEVSQSYDVKYGQVTSAKDVNQLESFYRYDSFGRIKEAEGPTGKKANVRYGWNTDSRIPALYFIESKAEGAPETITWYDKLGRPVLVKTDGLNKPVYQRTQYNNKGQVVMTTSPYHEGEEPIVTSYTYDNLGRTTSVSNDIGTTSSSYELANGNYKVTTITPAGQVYSVETDAAGKQVKATDAGGTLEYSYYSNGQLKEVRLSGEVMSSMTYDEYGRQTTLIDANAGTSEYVYNAYGELERQKDANGNIYTFTYDELGRVIERQGPEGSTFYSYYNNGNAIGAIETVTSANGFSTNYEYDDLARLTKTSEHIGTETFVHSMQYDDFNRPVSITYPGGFSIQKSYTDKGYLQSVSHTTLGLIWQTGTANAFGQYTNYSLGNGLNVNKSYDKHGVLKTTQTNGVYDLKYDIDLRTGNLLSREDAMKNKKEVFSYDVLDRLTKVQTNNTTTLEMSYMPNGNIDTKSDVGNYTYHDGKPNAVQYVTDRVTGAISENEQHIEYTPFLKVATIEEADWKAEFMYDANYSRKQVDFFNTTTGQLEKTHYYSGAYQKTTTPQGDVKEITYLACGDGLTAVHVKDNTNAQAPDGVLYYVHSDHQGSIVALTNQQKQVVVEQSFDAWGKRAPLSVPPQGGNTDFSWLRGYTGHEHLEEFDLINMNGRLYDPTLGRMLSPDNFVQSPFYTQNYNRYSYVYNNPLKYTDPTGYVSQAILAQHAARQEAEIAWRRQKDQEFLDNWARYKAISGGDGALANIHWGSGGGGVSIGMSIIGDTGYEEFQANSIITAKNYSLKLDANGNVRRFITENGRYIKTLSGGGTSNGIVNVSFLEGTALFANPFNGSTYVGGLHDFKPFDFEISFDGSAMGGLGVGRDFLDGAGYLSGAIGAVQIGMLDYRRGLSINNKIGTFGRFSSTYSGLGNISRFLGRSSTYIGAPLAIGFDYSSYREGEISGTRFAYRTGSIGASIGAGALIGGPWGAVAGAVIGGLSVGGEYIYDNMLAPLGREIQYQIYNFETAVRGGWYPGR